MNRKCSLSVITLTRNRAPMLTLCLGSLVGQLDSEDEIIIVDNGSTDTTKDVILQFQTRLPIRYFTSLRAGYPALYNVAIKKSTKKALVFLDDDCVASKNYISAVRQARDKHKDAVIQGQTYSLPRHNIYAEIMGDHYQNWLQINKTNSMEMRVFDNKNASVSRSTLQKYGMFFERLVLGSEDIELGIRLRHHGLKIVFDPSIVVYHHERSTLAGFLQQHLRIAKSEGVLDRCLKDENKIHMVNVRKLALHVKSAFGREMLYLVQGRICDFFLLPILYFLLLILRIWGYTTAQKTK